MNKRIEYDVRLLDIHGDAQDVRHFDSRLLAMAAAVHAMSTKSDTPSWCVAVAVERHDLRKDAAGDVCASYTTVATFGSKAALALWAGEEVAS